MPYKCSDYTARTRHARVSRRVATQDPRRLPRNSENSPAWGAQSPGPGVSTFCSSGAAGRAPAPARAAPSTDAPLRVARPPPCPFVEHPRKTLSRLREFPRVFRLRCSSLADRPLRTSPDNPHSNLNTVSKIITNPATEYSCVKSGREQDAGLAAAPISASVRLSRLRLGLAAASASPRARHPALPQPSWLARHTPRRARTAGLHTLHSLLHPSPPADRNTCGCHGRSAVIEREYTCALRRTIAVAHSFVLAQVTQEAHLSKYYWSTRQ